VGREEGKPAFTAPRQEPAPTSPSLFWQRQAFEAWLFKGSTWFFLSLIWIAKEIEGSGVPAI